jgi:hypothetical protein
METRFGDRQLTSSATAVVPSRPNNKLAFNCDLARSTSTEVGESDIRVHSRRVKWVKSSTTVKLRKVQTRIVSFEITYLNAISLVQ